MKKLLIVLLTFFACSNANATDLTFTWTPNADNTDGYSLVMGSGTNVVQDVPGRETSTTTFDTDVEECISFGLIAYVGSGEDRLESKVSEIAIVCPESKTPPAAIFHFSGTLTQLPEG